MYKNYLLALLSGLIFAMAWPTYGFSLMIFVAFVPLLIAENRIRNAAFKRQNLRTFLTSYLTFLIWNIVTTWWIWKATDFGAIFAIVVNSLLMSIVFQFYHLISRRKNLRFSLIFLASIWIAFEKFHHNWDFSWPWLTLGNVFSEQPHWVQWYEITGIFGGSLWVLIVNFLFYKLWLLYRDKVAQNALIKQGILALSVIVLGISISLYRYQTYQEKGMEMTAIVLQPNTNPYTEKYHQSSELIAHELLTLAESKMTDKVSFVLAPETVFSNRSTLQEFIQTPAFLQLIQFEHKYPFVNILSGIDLFEIYPKTIPRSKTGNKFSNTEDAWYESYNAAILISPNSPPEVYHKSKLVVGVEHFPFRSVLEPLLGNAMINLGGSISTLTPQKEVSVFKHSNTDLSAAPIICYESIYGEFVGKYVKKGATFLAIVTNDSWWGNTEGHKQLLSYARLRAIEHRRAVARSANSGISAFINQKGEIISSLPYETQGALKGTILANDSKTIYSIYGDFIARIAAFVAVIFLIVGVFVKNKS